MKNSNQGTFNIFNLQPLQNPNLNVQNDLGNHGGNIAIRNHGDNVARAPQTPDARPIIALQAPQREQVRNLAQHELEAIPFPQIDEELDNIQVFTPIQNNNANPEIPAAPDRINNANFGNITPIPFALDAQERDDFHTPVGQTARTNIWHLNHPSGPIANVFEGITSTYGNTLTYGENTPIFDFSPNSITRSPSEYQLHYNFGSFSETNENGLRLIDPRVLNLRSVSSTQNPDDSDLSSISEVEENSNSFASNSEDNRNLSSISITVENINTIEPSNKRSSTSSSSEDLEERSSKRSKISTSSSQDETDNSDDSAIEGVSDILNTAFILEEDQVDEFLKIIEDISDDNSADNIISAEESNSSHLSIGEDKRSESSSQDEYDLDDSAIEIEEFPIGATPISIRINTNSIFNSPEAHEALNDVFILEEDSNSIVGLGFDFSDDITS